MNTSCTNDYAVDCLTAGKSFKRLIFFLQIAVCIAAFFIILFALPVSAHALPPPSDDEIEKYTKDGTIGERSKFAQTLGDGDIDKALVQNFELRTQKFFGYTTNSLAPMFNYCMPSTGNVKVPVFIVDFSDAPYTPTLTNDQIQQQIFGTGSSSLSTFYKTSSYNLLNISGDVMGVYRAKNKLSYYKAIQDPVVARQTLVEEVLTYYDQQGLDFTKYDSNGDQHLDAFYILWNGPTGGWGSDWYTYKATWHDDTFKLDGLSLYNYTMYSIGAQGGIVNNVLEHETGHLLGLPDYYSYDMTGNSPPGGLGGFDMMDSDQGDHNIFSKYLLGWVTPQSVSSGSSNIVLEPSATNPDGLIIMPDWDNNAFSEYYIAEYLTRAGNYTSSPFFDKPGIRLLHVDARTDSTGTNFLCNNSYSEDKLIRVVEADGLQSIENYNEFDNGDLYRTGQEFSPDTYPNSDGYGGVFTGISLSNFSTGGTTASVQVGFVDSQAKPAVLRTFPADGSSAAEKTSKIQIVYNNSVYQDTGFGDIKLTCLSNATTVDIERSIQNNVLSILPVNPLSSESQYSLTIPVDAIRNAKGANADDGTTIHFSTAMGASVIWGDTKLLPEEAGLETEALCPLPDGGALVTFYGWDSENNYNCGFIKTDQNGDIVWSKVFPQLIDTIFSSTSVAPLQDGGVLVSNSYAVTVFNASMEQTLNTTGKAFVLSDGNIGVFFKTNFTEYTPAGNIVSIKTISTKNMYAISRTSNGFLFVGNDFNTSAFEFIQLDSSLNIIQSATTTLSSLPRCSYNMFFFPAFQADDCIRVFRCWDESNISIIKLGWDMSIINETQLSSTADGLEANTIFSDITTDGTVYLVYSTEIRSYDYRVMTMEKVLSDNTVEWRKDVAYSNGNIDCTGFVTSGLITSVIAHIYSPSCCFQTITLTGPVPSNTVSFDSLGGSGVPDIIADPGTTIQEPDDPKKTGYDFNGWYPTSSFDTNEISFPYTVTGNVTMYAKWTPVIYTITYDLGGGTASNPDTYTIETPSFILSNPTKAGYIFNGWSGTDITGLSSKVTIGTGSTGNRFYTANWTYQPISTYLSAINLTPGASLTHSFLKTRYSYTVKLTEHTSSVTITPVKENDTASMSINGDTSASYINLDLKNGQTETVKIKVSYPGKGSHTYNLTVTRDESTDNDLSDIKYTEGIFSPTFDPDVKSYTLTLDENTSGVTITPEKDTKLESADLEKVYIDGKARASKTYPVNNGGKATCTIKVVSQTGKPRTYTVYITRDKSTDALLNKLYTNSSKYPVTPVLDNNLASDGYTVTLPDSVSSVTLYAKPEGYGATTKITNLSTKASSTKGSLKVSLANGKYADIKITVTAQASTSVNPITKDYTLRVYRESAISGFSALPKVGSYPAFKLGGDNMLTFKWKQTGGGEATLQIQSDPSKPDDWQTIYTDSVIMSSGTYTYSWDGKVSGDYLAAGTYKVRISVSYTDPDNGKTITSSYTTLSFKILNN